VVDAKEKEIRSLIDNEVFQVVENKGQSTISSKWIITEKLKDGKTITKARLVTRGFEEDSSRIRNDK